MTALFRVRGISTTGRGGYDAAQRAEWLAMLDGAGVRLRATTFHAELEVLQALRPAAKAALVAEAKRDSASGVLRTIPFLGRMRNASTPRLIATITKQLAAGGREERDTGAGAPAAKE